VTEEPSLPDPRRMRVTQPPLVDNSHAALTWAHRASQAVGSSRFAETVRRASFYFARAASHAHTPGEEALVSGLQAMIDDLVAADAAARVLLAGSVLGMNAAEACEFVEMIESGENSE
jgi:hypothetical protein